MTAGLPPTEPHVRLTNERRVQVTSNPIDPADDLVLEQILNAREHFALYTRGVKQLELRRQLLQQFDEKLRVTIIVQPELIQEIDQLTTELDRLQGFLTITKETLTRAGQLQMKQGRTRRRPRILSSRTRTLLGLP